MSVLGKIFSKRQDIQIAGGRVRFMRIEVGHTVRYNKLFDYEDESAIGRVVFRTEDEIVVLFEKEGSCPWLDIVREIEMEIVWQLTSV